MNCEQPDFVGALIKQRNAAYAETFAFLHHLPLFVSTGMADTI
jgi:hypothetical protein